MAAVPASIVIPTRGRPSYLQVALASIAPQAAAAGAEVLVIDDGGPSAENRGLAARVRVRYEAHPRPRGESWWCSWTTTSVPAPAGSRR
jgi:glycosyltransferase involved in cell wall biosynthesis